MLRLFSAFIIFLLLVTQYRLWWGENGLLELRQLRNQIAQQENENKYLRQRNLRLDAEVNELKGDMIALEERARFDLGMIGQGETFFWLVGDPPTLFKKPSSLQQEAP